MTRRRRPGRMSEGVKTSTYNYPKKVSFLWFGKGNTDTKGGPLVGFACDRELPTQLCSTFPHTGEAQMMTAWHGLGIKTSSVILDQQLNPIRDIIERDGHSLGFGMFLDIRQPFLRDPVESRIDDSR